MNTIEVPSNGHTRNGNGHTNGNGKFSSSPNGSPFNNSFLKKYNNDSNNAEEL